MTRALAVYATVVTVALWRVWLGAQRARADLWWERILRRDAQRQAARSSHPTSHKTRQTRRPKC